MDGTADNMVSDLSGCIPLHAAAIRLDDRDDVAIVKQHLTPGTVVTWHDQGTETHVVVQDQITSGHKVSLHDIPADSPVRRYGQVIGFASLDIGPGEHVHTHNLRVQKPDREYQFGTQAPADPDASKVEQRVFVGFRRPDGQVGTRNHIAVISSVNCSAHVCREIACHFTSDRMSQYQNVDSVFALTHHSGCGHPARGLESAILRRTLCGMARHPNVGACVLVGLGCESNQVADLVTGCELLGQRACPTLVIQELGGIAATIDAGIHAVEALLPEVNDTERTPVSMSELKLAVQCGGSDGWSGVTANPAAGFVSDEIIRQGGTVVLAETPELVGAVHLLTARVADPAVGRKLLEFVEWWERRTRELGVLIDDNRSAGNEAGGLTTIYEKALGAVAKGGSSSLTAVYDYAEPVSHRGLTFMNTPGFDPMSVTGQIAGGCTLVLFTTGRGSVFGSIPAPTIKVTSNSKTYEHLIRDVDLDAGKILDGATVEQVGTQLLDLVTAVASGRRTKSELQGVGQAEFSPWNLGGTL